MSMSGSAFRWPAWLETAAAAYPVLVLLKDGLMSKSEM
jgi:hypothetical protein